MTSQAKPINNPFRRIVSAEDYRAQQQEEEQIDIDAPEDQDYNNYDYGNEYGNENDFDYPPQQTGGFTMSDNKATNNK